MPSKSPQHQNLHVLHIHSNSYLSYPLIIRKKKVNALRISKSSFITLRICWLSRELFHFHTIKRTRRHIISIKTIKSIGYRSHHEQFCSTNPVFREYSSDILGAITVSYCHIEDWNDRDICFCVKYVFLLVVEMKEKKG